MKVSQRNDDGEKKTRLVESKIQMSLDGFGSFFIFFIIAIGFLKPFEVESLRGRHLQEHLPGWKIPGLQRKQEFVQMKCLESEGSSLEFPFNSNHVKIPLWSLLHAIIEVTLSFFLSIFRRVQHNHDRVLVAVTTYSPIFRYWRSCFSFFL